MRALRRAGIFFVLGVMLGGAKYRARDDRALLAATVQVRHGTPSQRHHGMLTGCVTGSSSISPCTATATINVGDQTSKFFQFQNNEGVDQDVLSSCTTSGFATCTATPSFQVIHAGHQGTIELTVTGTSAGLSVVTLEASGDVDVFATDTVTVNPIIVMPTETIQQTPDTTYTQTFTVQNVDGASHTVNLVQTCSAGFTCSLLTTTPMAVAAHAVDTAKVSVTTSGEGTSGTVQLAATPTVGVGGATGIVTVNIPVPLPPTVSVLPHNGYNHSTALCAASCFNVTAGYTTPAYTSMDLPRSVSLVYSSAMAYPLGVVQVNVKDSSFRLAQQISISAVRGGVNETFTNGTTELYVSQSSTDTSTKRLAAQLSTALATGIYHDTTTIKSRWTSGIYSGTVTQTSVPTTLLIDNEQSSPYGAGWQIAGLQHLVFTSDSLSLALTNGTGSMLLFTRPTKARRGSRLLVISRRWRRS